jgi:hypothetical protein
MRTRSTAFVLAALLCAAPAAAQSARPERPYRGIFGGGVGNTEQLLTVKFAVNGGYDDNVLAGDSGGVSADPRAAKSGGYGQAQSELSYSLNRKRVGFAASLGTTQRRYTSVLGNFLGTYSGGASGWFQVAKHTRLALTQSSSFQPFLSYSFFPVPGAFEGELAEGDLPPIENPSFDLAIGKENQWRHSASASLSQGLSSRATLSLGGSYNTANASQDSLDLKSYSYDGRLSLNISRGLGVHFGYGYRDGGYGGATSNSPVVHNLDIGVDYSRPLSISRRTKLQFGTGSAAMRDLDRTVYRITGNATLSYEFKRTWNAALNYKRDAGFLQNLRAPVFADAVSFSVGGMPTRRLQVATQIGAALGTVGVTASASGYNSYYGTASCNVALSRYAGLNVAYSYYQYSFDSSVELPQLSSRNLDRQSLQGGVTFWLPIVHRTRRPDAAR